MPELINKAVWLESVDHSRNVIELLERIYESDAWEGAMLFHDLEAGFVLVACFHPELYPGDLMAWECLFPPRDLRDVTLEQALSLPNRYRPYFGLGIPDALRHLKLLPT